MEEVKKIQVVLIKGNKKMDDMAHTFDVFEPFKRLCWPVTMELILSKEIDKTKLIPILKKGIEEMGEEFVVAAFIPGEKESAWVDPSVKVISNGRQWALLDKVLIAYGYVTA